MSLPKILFVLFISIFCIFSISLACDPTPPPQANANATAVGIGIAGAQANANNHVVNTSLNCNHASSDQAQGQQQGQEQTALGGDGGQGGAGGAASSSSHTGDNALSNNIVERTQFNAINPTSVRIGEASKPVPQFYIQGQTEDDNFSGKRSNALQAGVTIPIAWGTGINGALFVEQQHLRDRNLHEREKHQAEMAVLCMELHKVMQSTGAEMSPELWNRCAGFEHFNNASTMKILGPHNGEMNPRQYSPHHSPYHNNLK